MTLPNDLATLGDHPNRFVVYDDTANRSGDGPEAFLGDYAAGYPQSDAYAGYDRIHQRGIVAVGCWAHARRKFYEAKASDPEHAHAALAWIGRLYDVEREAKAEAACRPAAHGGEADAGRLHALEEQIRAEWRIERSGPLLESFFAWLEEVSLRILPKSSLGEAVAYARSNRQRLHRYLEAGDLPIDNNAVERALRPIAVGRNNWLHLGSDEGGRTAAVLLSVVQSCRAWGGGAAGLPAGCAGSGQHASAFHSLRKTFVTNLARSGVMPKVAQALARHSDINLAMGVHTDLEMDELREAIDRLDSFVNRDGDPDKAESNPGRSPDQGDKPEP